LRHLRHPPHHRRAARGGGGAAAPRPARLDRARPRLARAPRARGERRRPVSRFRIALALAAGLLGLAGPALAQDAYPSRPITMVVPFPPGGVADLTARPVAAALERTLKNPVGVVSKTGPRARAGTQV